MKNFVSGSRVAASVDATLLAGVCTALSRSSGRVGREHVGQKTSCVEGGAAAPEGSCGRIHLRENSASGSWVETSCETAMCGIVCVAASRNGVGIGCGGGGGALMRMQRCKNSANESCVAASASVADIKSLVAVRVEPV